MRTKCLKEASGIPGAVIRTMHGLWDESYLLGRASISDPLIEVMAESPGQSKGCWAIALELAFRVGWVSSTLDAHEGDLGHECREVLVSTTDSPNESRNDQRGKTWWHVPAILVIKGQRQEAPEFEASLAYILSLSQKNQGLGLGRKLRW